ncbi:hypothetical protein SLS58_004400 [Diplodia intermedia]|uniref:Uncharacterized protein n=1 Tax=Diplodia intermedia TaxID=856260 RepID=A0ABR3TUJ9_9PEZI
MVDFIKFAMYGAIKPPANYNPDNYYVDKEDKKSKNKSKDTNDDKNNNKNNNNDNDDRSSVRSFESSDSTIAEKDGKTTARSREKENKDSLKAPETSEGSSSRSRSRSRSRRRVKVHDAGPGGAKGFFNSVFGNHGVAGTGGYASVKW